jgi:asparagine synthase (glutamine-hydrolysing)
MHCSLEARSPLLDHELAEFCAALPLEMKLRNRGGKFLLKQLAAKTFGQAFVNRKKQGFGIPLAKWLKHSLRTRLTEVLSDRCLMEPFDHGVIARTLGGFLADRPAWDHSSRLWALFMYGLWRDSARAVPLGAQPGRPELLESC